ncbi:transposase [Elizabethkingia ursingii]
MLLFQIVEAILYRLKTGCQWRELPTKQFFEVAYSWKSVYYHFCRWCRDGSWERFKEYLFDKYKKQLDMSCVQLDGFHTPVKRGGESFGYQGRKNVRPLICFFYVITEEFQFHVVSL